ncbi:hypothetical protein FT641_19595 [Bacillus paranthracis]|uniref:hypothetical protein n=1 Tax=Bacillus paranthracis TaxID=2026186 RepID=UPI00187ABD60|nr:hypothetical protein [Bacillus paranthracis]MBE7114735.1 hypothetical protein [Bacillus paranthracis]MBE7154898.1 hypothetical protein [Bacillus paranthracis]
MLLSVVLLTTVAILGVWRERYFFRCDGKVWKIPLFWLFVILMVFVCFQKLTGTALGDIFSSLSLDINYEGLHNILGVAFILGGILAMFWLGFVCNKIAKTGRGLVAVLAEIPFWCVILFFAGLGLLFFDGYRGLTYFLIFTVLMSVISLAVLVAVRVAEALHDV